MKTIIGLGYLAFIMSPVVPAEWEFLMASYGFTAVFCGCIVKMTEIAEEESCR